MDMVEYGCPVAKPWLQILGYDREIGYRKNHY